MAYQIRLSQFEGPLDLLLHLIRRDKINIYDIPISHITREYLSYIDVMRELELAMAGEFFVMAATLMRIKAQMLLPRRVEEEEMEEDPREELVKNLIEYRKFKEAANHLSEKEEVRRQLFTRPPSVIPAEFNSEKEREMEVSVFDLMDAFRSVMDELKKKVTYRIERETFTIEEKIEHVRDSLAEKSEVLFTELLSGAYDKLEVIVTFLAILEMIKAGELLARQMLSGNDVWLYRRDENENGTAGNLYGAGTKTG
ncbi:MAG: segregation/condensation protein A [Candidatus Krumholzibacteria bacterium]|nr:segregation/condensation protein A [Candidatus Krumholzibacteria bacterium]